MSTTERAYHTSLEAVRSAALAVPTGASAVSCLHDDDLLGAQRTIAETIRVLKAAATMIAGEVGHRSRRELGYQGLAQREGFSSPEALVRHTTGSTSREAITLVQVGALVHDAVAELDPSEEVREPWMLSVGVAVNAGLITVDAARAIKTGLGKPTAQLGEGGGITVEALAAAAEALVQEAEDSHADRILQLAREMRDDLDEAGIADRERQIRQERSFRRVKRPNGLSRYIFDPDIESAAFLDDVYDKITSPRRNGPRFVEEADKAWAESVATDERSTDQYVHDSVVSLLRIAVQGETNESRAIIGSRMPAVRVLVTAEALQKRTGHGRVEGIEIPVSIQTVERIACTNGTVPIVFNRDFQPLDVGREHRLYTARQRVALAARDGGCTMPDCDRPASSTEAHHINHWVRDGGRTDIADGILLCVFHHMLCHNNGWEIVRDGGEYWLIPPKDVDPRQRRRRMRSRSAALRDLKRQHQRDREHEREHERERERPTTEIVDKALEPA